MGKRRVIDLQFPLGGLNRRLAYEQQPPYTTPMATNVRPEGPIEERLRGGSRSGLQKRFADQLGSGNPIRMTWPLRTVPIRQASTSWTDDFSSDDGAWKDAGIFTSWTVADGYAKGSTTAATRGQVLDAQTMDKSRAFSVGALIDFEARTHYDLRVGLDDSSPVLNTAIGVRLSFGLTDGDLTGWRMQIQKDAAFVVENEYPNLPAFVDANNLQWLWLHVRADWTVQVEWGNWALAAWRYDLGDYRMAGTRVALSMTVDEVLTPNRQPKIDEFAYEYITAPASTYAPFIVMASSNGLLYKEHTDGTLDAVVNPIPPTPTLASDKMLSAAQRLGKLYIADDETRVRTPDDLDALEGVITAGVLDHDDEDNWDQYGIEPAGDIVEVTDVVNPSSLVANGVDINGTTVTGFVAKITSVSDADGLTLANVTGGCDDCNFRVVRAPKIYNPATNTLSIWWPTNGTIPVGATIVDVYKDAMVLGGDRDNPGAWWMSAIGDPLDFRTDQTDGRAATSGAATNSDVGGLPRPTTAIAAIKDDYLVFASSNELWIMRGHPMQGGLIDNISYTVGMLDHRAYCTTPEGATVFLAPDGLYALGLGPDFSPQPLSRERIPQELAGIDPDAYEVILEYSTKAHGVFIFVTPAAGPGTRHYFFHWPTQSFWPCSYPADYEPTSACFSSRDDAVLLGCRDGYVRQFAKSQATDDGTEIPSEVFYGPLKVAADGLSDGMVQEIVGELADGSADVDWAVLVGDTPQTAMTARDFASGTWSAGLNRTSHPKAGGRWAFVRLTNNTTSAWAVERVTVVLESVGRKKLLS